MFNRASFRLVANKKNEGPFPASSKSPKSGSYSDSEIFFLNNNKSHQPVLTYNCSFVDLKELYKGGQYHCINGRKEKKRWGAMICPRSPNKALEQGNRAMVSWVAVQSSVHCLFLKAFSTWASHFVQWTVGIHCTVGSFASMQYGLSTLIKRTNRGRACNFIMCFATNQVSNHFRQLLSKVLWEHHNQGWESGAWPPRCWLKRGSQNEAPGGVCAFLLAGAGTSGLGAAEVIAVATAVRADFQMDRS